MSRRKKDSKILADAQKRLSGLKAIDNKLNLGGGLTIENINKSIEVLTKELEAYNALLAQSDEKLRGVKEAERSLKDLHVRALAGVAAIYGKNSNEYEKAGGIKLSERKRSKRQKNH